MLLIFARALGDKLFGSSSVIRTSREDAQAPTSIFFYMFALTLVLLWRPNLDLGFLLTPTYLMLILVFPLLLIRRRVSLYRFDASLFLCYFFLLLTSSYAPDPSTSVKFFLGVGVFLGMYFCFKLSLHSVQPARALSAFEKVGKIYFISALLFYLLGLLSYGDWQEHQLYYGLMVERAIPRLVAFGFDPNMSAMTLIPFFFYFMLSKNNYFWLSLGLFLILATMSRGAILSMMVGLTCLAVLRPNKASIRAIGVALLLVVFGFIGMVVFDLLPVRYFEQRLAGIASGSGRVEIWSNALEMFLARPVVGWGGFSFRDVNQLLFNDFHFAHNTYLEVLVESGLVGFVIFCSFVFFMLRRAIQLSANPLLLFVLPALFSFAVSMFFISVYINQILVLYLSLLNFSWAGEDA